MISSLLKRIFVNRFSWKARVLVLSFLSPGIVFAAEAAEPPLDTQLNERILSVPSDPARPVLLQVTLFKPDGPGPFPLAVLNHGKEAIDSHLETRYRSVYLARYFVSRGYEVVLPMLRGFAGSGGTSIVQGCDAEPEGVNQARDIAAVIGYMKKQPEVDPNRIVVSGQSYGGWVTLALGSLNVPGVKGLLNFAGGRQAPSCSLWQSDLAVGAYNYAQHTTVPSLWFYGDNDSKFSVETWRDMFKYYQQGGGKAQIVAYGPFLRDSHNFLGAVEAFPIWMPKVDAFLSSLGLPAKELRSDLLPQKYPAPTHFAAIDDVSAVPLINDQGRKSYAAFLGRTMPRIFAIAPDGTAVVTYGGYDPLDRALNLCKKIGRTCRVYAFDDQVVW